MGLIRQIPFDGLDLFPTLLHDLALAVATNDLFEVMRKQDGATQIRTGDVSDRTKAQGTVVTNQGCFVLSESWGTEVESKSEPTTERMFMCLKGRNAVFAACFVLASSSVWAQTPPDEDTADSGPCRAVYLYTDMTGTPVEITREIPDLPNDNEAWERDWTDVFRSDPALLAARPDWNTRFDRNLPMTLDVLSNWVPLRVERATERYLRWLQSDEPDPDFPARRIEVQLTAENDLLRVRLQRTEAERYDGELNFLDLNYDLFEYAEGRLVRATFISTTWECVDSNIAEWVLHYDEAGLLVEGEYRNPYHPFCDYGFFGEDREFDHERVRYSGVEEPPLENAGFRINWSYDDDGRLETMERVPADESSGRHLTGTYEYECALEE